MDAEEIVSVACARGRSAARALSILPREPKDRALRAIADGLVASSVRVLEANALDVKAARERGTKESLVDRLALDAKRLAAIADGVRSIAALPDPVGEVIAEYTRPNGLRVRQVRVPIGLVAMVYEARPNVTVEASALALKSGNAVVLRGGSDAAKTNAALGDVIADALDEAVIPRGAVNVLPAHSHEIVRALVGTPGRVDLAIPRGGEGLIREVAEHARVPLVLHYQGVCHLYVDRDAAADLATRIVVNSKLSRPGVCNALECLLVCESDAARLLPPIAAALLAGGCELRGCPETRQIVPEACEAHDDDFGHEFLDKVLAIKVVDGLDAALVHIARYGSQHTEAIVTPHEESAARFRNEVDAACVVTNASTRFHDGAELGLGAEIGIATSRIHWRGPMGLVALTTMKWLVTGDGQVR